jgi:hypothetical protein
LSNEALAHTGSSHSKFIFQVNFCCCLCHSKRPEWVQGLVFDFVSTYADKLLAPCSTPKMEEHPLSTVQDAICNISTSNLHIQWPFPQSKTWEGAMSWWQGTTHFSGS